ncbi:MAG: hypothetical protein FJ096_12375 [Deltaproteobacteria bacterium]|nr:hypothetical protein [Deltaproteobacteria bacterium]
MLEFWLIVIGLVIVFVVGISVMLARFYRMVEQGKALIVNSTTGQKVTFTGAVVLPIINRSEVMDISVKTIEIDRRGKEGLICRDNIRADIKVTFFVRVNKTVDDVLRVAQSLGCARASDQNTLDTLFAAKFSEALKSVGKGLDFEDLYTKREKFRDDIVNVIGQDLNGYVLEDAAIDYLEQTPLDLLDPENILDADGIRKITSITTQRNIETNDLKQRERMEIGKQNLASDEAVFRYDQERADAEAKKNKEITIAQSRESEEARRIQIEEQLKTKKAQEKSNEEAQIAEQNRQRAVMVAEQARLRELAVEQVRVTKAKEVEDIGRAKEVQVRDIERQEEVEVRKKKIADVVRDRIAVEKTVATEEEAIKDLRTLAAAKRDKDSKVVAAEGIAQEVLVTDVKKAEADEVVAQHRARQRLVLADAELEAADRDARAKMRLAEGIQAEEAAKGLADVRVKEADAAAVEKQGLAKVRVREAEIALREREGTVEAENVKRKEFAEAAGIQQKGLAAVQVKEADSVAVEKLGKAEATAIREKLLAEVAAKQAEADAIKARMLAEAEGLKEKAEAMKNLEGTGREHEEFRLRLQTQKEIAVQELETRMAISAQQSQILAKAFEKASINIVGGDGAFFDRFVKAVGVGSSIDGAVANSKTLQALLHDHVGSDGRLGEELTKLVGSAMAKPADTRTPDKGKSGPKGT